MGRPPLFNEQLAAEICERIADGESLRKICKDKHIPSIETVRKWLAAGVKANEKDDPHAVFLAQYAHAREDQADSYADKVTDLADQAVVAGDRTVIEGIRVAIDALKWAAGKRKPKVYGDKVQTEHTGEMKVVTQRIVLDTPPPGWEGTA